MSVTQFILKCINPFKYYLLGTILVILLYVAHISLRPYLLKIIIDIASMGNIKNSINQLWEITAYYIGIQILMALMWRFSAWCSLKYEPALKNYIVWLMFKYSLKHDYRFFQNHLSGSLVSKINDLSVHVPFIVSTIVHTYLADIIFTLVTIGILWHLHLWFGIAVLIWSILFVTLSISIIQRFNYLSKDTAEAASKVIGNLVDSLSNILNIILFSLKSNETKRLSRVQKEYLYVSVKRRWFILWFNLGQDLSFLLYQTICIALLIYLYSVNKITPGDFALVLSFNILIIDHLWGMAEATRNLSESIGIVEQALNTFYIPLQVQDKPDAKPLVLHKGEIVFDSVQFNYKGTVPLFQKKSIIIHPGEKIGLIGYSGSGKSTFVNLILRLYDINSGYISIDGQDIRDVTQDSLRAVIGMIPQEPILFHRSIMENIRYGHIDATDDEVIEAAKKAHAHHFILKLDQGYQSLVGERGVKLSGGQRQRIAIARAFLKNAPLLILDEATSQLDSVSEGIIQSVLWELMKNKTTIVIAHRLSTLLHLDRILVFDQGKIVEDGTHEQLLSKNSLYKTLWEAQVGGFLPEKKLKQEEL